MKKIFSHCLAPVICSCALFSSCGGGGGGGDAGSTNGKKEAESSTIDWLPNGTSLTIRLDSIAAKVVNGEPVNNPDFSGVYRNLQLSVGANASGRLFLDGRPVACKLDFRQNGNAFDFEIKATNPVLVITFTQGQLNGAAASAGNWAYQYQDSINGDNTVARGTAASLIKEGN